MGIVRMAAKRVSQSAINWAELSKKIPDSQRMAFQALKTKSDVSLRAINSLPEKLPVIDWAAYQSANSALVNDFKTKYEALDVPYPKDTLAASIEAQGAAAKADYEKFVKESGARAVSFKDEMAKWSAMLPPSEMNRVGYAGPAPPGAVSPAQQPQLLPLRQAVLGGGAGTGKGGGTQDLLRRPL